MSTDQFALAEAEVAHQKSAVGAELHLLSAKARQENGFAAIHGWDASLVRLFSDMWRPDDRRKEKRDTGLRARPGRSSCRLRISWCP